MGLLVSGGVVARAAPVSRFCSAHGEVCLETVPLEGTDGVSYWIASKVPGSITVDVDVSFENMESSARLPMTVVLAKPSRRRLTVLTPLRAGEKWHYNSKFDWQFGDPGAKRDEGTVYALPISTQAQAVPSWGPKGGDNQNLATFTVLPRTPVLAARGGTVVDVVQDFGPGGPNPEFKDRANLVRIEHSDHTIGEYIHLLTNGAVVRAGDKVRSGELIGYSGNSGWADVPELQFGVSIPVNGTRRAFVPISMDVPAQPSTAEGCGPQDAVCLEAIRTSTPAVAVEYWAKSVIPGPVLIDVRISTENMDVAGKLSTALSLNRPERRLVATLKPLDPAKPWSYRSSFHYQVGDPRAKHDPAVVYRLPTQKERAVRIMQGFHGRYTHTGLEAFCVDFDLPRGSPVFAARGGTVLQIERGFGEGGPDSGYDDRANFVRILHADRTVGEYDHFKDGGVVVSPGRKVKEGELLGYSGNSGHSTGPHLHFEVYVPIDAQTRASIPILFEAGNGPEELIEGRSYTP